MKVKEYFLSKGYEVYYESERSITFDNENKTVAIGFHTHADGIIMISEFVGLQAIRQKLGHIEGSPAEMEMKPEWIDFVNARLSQIKERVVWEI